MKYNVVESDTFRELYDKTVKYLEANSISLQTSIKFSERTSKEIELLQYSPYVHPRLRLLRKHKYVYRRILIMNYFIIYTVVGDTVYLMYVYYGPWNMDQLVD